MVLHSLGRACAVASLRGGMIARKSGLDHSIGGIMATMAPVRPATETPRANPAETFARFAHGLRHDDIPDAVRGRSLYHVLDALGLALAASRRQFARKAHDGLAVLAAPGPVPVFGFGTAWNPRDAALLNGLLCHGLDYDDTHLRAVVHPTTCAWPTALSAAVLAERSGRDLLTAFLIGVEVGCRLGAVAHGAFHQIGFHPTGICNIFGAALATGRLLGLDEAALRQSQGIALSLASGSLEFLEDGAWTKRLHPGWSAAAGITAAALAKGGYVGATRPYDGRFGLFRAFLGGDDAACDYGAIADELGRSWAILNTAIKPFPACHLAHGCIEAAIDLAREGGIEPAHIRRILALVPAEAVTTICEPLQNKRRPRNAYEAQFSTPYLVATALLRGRLTLDELEPPALADRATLRLAALADYAADPASGFPRHYSGEVVLEFDDGSTRRARRQVNRGAPDAPLTDDEIVAKFHDNAVPVVGADRAADMAALILSLDTDRAARDLARGLTRLDMT
jgi:2-methylcitrate dehydratase PrpD